MITHSITPMRNFKCQTFTRKGIRCGKFAEFPTEDGHYLCQSCYWKYIRAFGEKKIKSDKVSFGDFEKIRKVSVLSSLFPRSQREKRGC